MLNKKKNLFVPLAFLDLLPSFGKRGMLQFALKVTFKTLKSTWQRSYHVSFSPTWYQSARTTIFAEVIFFFLLFWF